MVSGFFRKATIVKNHQWCIVYYKFNFVSPDFWTHAFFDRNKAEV